MVCLDLKNHPFTIEAFFESSLVLVFAVPKEEVAHLIPECLELDIFHDRWAFIAMAMVKTKGLRPKGFPKIFGNDFFLIGYRVFVKYISNAGKRLRGLFILKSETNKKRMEYLGNIFTHYNYSTTDITQTKRDNITKMVSAKSNFMIEIEEELKNVPLPPNTPFADWKEARRFVGPLPFTFSYNSAQKKVLIIEGVRQNWVPAPVKVITHEVSFLNTLHLTEARLANAFLLKNIPYHWKKGRTELWKG